MKRLFNCLVLFSVLAMVVFTSCGDKATKTEDQTTANKTVVQAPDFNADTAYALVAKQVAFGPRVPGSKAHLACGDWMVNYLKSNGWTVQEQPFEAVVFTGAKFNCRNIIASYNPQATTRILLAAHWDTRPFADQDSVDKNKPIDGANDGGSGVGVLLHLAQVINQAKSKPNVGIDIVLFDAEDYGDTEDYVNKAGEEPGQWWCLGSKYWSKNKHQANYSAYYGILLDMVGAKDAKFYMEGASIQFAPTVVDKVWRTAHQAGFADRFPMQPVDAITDDHVFVNQIGKINMIDIIEYNPNDGQYFSETWHRHSDNMSNIDKASLKAVGQTLLQVLYNE